MSISECCLKGFEWNGTPDGKIVPFPTVSGGQAYMTGKSSERAIMYIHDLQGFDFINAKLLADHFAREVDTTVVIPDFFGGESLPHEILNDPTRVHEIDIPGFLRKNSREKREPEIFASARVLRSEYEKLGVVGYCFGGWSSFRLGAKGNDLVDCISAGQPTWLTNDDIDNIGVPVQVLAPEFDHLYTADLKEHTFKVVPTLGIPFDYQHFPGVEHACLTRGDPERKGEREALERGKNAVVAWMKQFLHD